MSAATPPGSPGRPAVVLLSGGLDSTTCLAIAEAEGFTPVALSFRYGQRHTVELDCARRVAEAAGGTTSPTFQYRFTWKTPAFGGVAGSCHALEIPFVFAALGNAGAELFFGGPAGPDLWSLSEAMQDSWLAFARTGDPGHDGIPHWPAWEPDARPVLRFDVERVLVPDPYSDERALWEGVL